MKSKWVSKLFIWLGSMGPQFIPSLLRALVFLIYCAVSEIFIERHQFKITLKRVVLFWTFSVAIVGMMIWNHIGFLLDNIFFPDWHKQDVNEPLFIIGNPRSGTTWAHRLIALDEELFTSMKTWEIMFAASVTWRHIFFALYKFDKKYLKSFFLSALDYSGNWLARDCKLHHVGLFEHEEDEWIMIHIFLSQLVLLAFPVGGALLYPLVEFDNFSFDMIPSATRKSIMLYYKDCVRRHMYFHKRPKFLSKNPPFTMRLESLCMVFPDARFLCLVRDPLQCVPSMISYISHVNICCVKMRVTSLL